MAFCVGPKSKKFGGNTPEQVVGCEWVKTLSSLEAISFLWSYLGGNVCLKKKTFLFSVLVFHIGPCMCSQSEVWTVDFSLNTLFPLSTLGFSWRTPIKSYFLSLCVVCFTLFVSTAFFSHFSCAIVFMSPKVGTISWFSTFVSSELWMLPWSFWVQLASGFLFCLNLITCKSHIWLAGWYHEKMINRQVISLYICTTPPQESLYQLKLKHHIWFFLITFCLRCFLGSMLDSIFLPACLSSCLSPTV